MRVLRSDDKGWYICEHKAEHNHSVSVNCMEKLHWKSHRHIDRYTRDLVKQLRENNISLSKVYSVVGSFFGSVKEVPFTKRSLKTLCGKLNREQSENDATKTIEVFNAMRAEDPEFKYSVQVDSDGRVKTLMWTTGRSIEQFKCFGDVVTFDTTYKTNLYDMPFGLFVGVNNHFQSIIFGGVLMSDEKIETFKWIFTEFFQMIGAPQPRTMLTDQARAMEVAIEDVMPHTTHRWCKWHVLKKAKECLGPLLGKGSEFKQEFNKMVHHIVSEKEFEDGWACMVEKHGLQNNVFLTQIYETRMKWAKPYFMDVFCAKMTSTQRSESANHLLKGYVPPGSPMHLFVRQYEKMQFDRDSEESYQEKRTKLGGVVLAQNLPIEVHASKIYTRAMFEKFGEALYECGSYVLIEDVPRREYTARHVKKDSRDKWCKNEFRVQVNEDADEFKCECGMFEHFGMVCSHALKVMIQLGLQEVPAGHIMKRWTRDARDILPPEFLRYQKDQGPLKYSSRRHNNLHLMCLEIVRLGDSNVDAYTLAIEQLRNVKMLLEPVAAIRDGMGLSDRELAGDSAGSTTAQKHHFGPTNQLQSASQCSDSFAAPSKKRPAGRPTTSRDKAPYEQPAKRSRFCSICRGQGHKSTTCPQRGDLPKAPRKSPRCSRCSLTGHRRNTCTNTPKADFYG
ncbi:hypothetical protein VPH35_019938 [Triticum aestivum]